MRAGEQLASCAFCDLPLGFVEESETNSAPAYCCFGCRLVDGMTRRSESDLRGQGLATWALTRVLLAAFLAMGVMVFSIALLAPVWFPAPDGEHPLGPLAGLFRWITWCLATPAVVLLVVPMLRESLLPLLSNRKASGQERVESNTVVSLLIVSGALAAYALSTVSVLRGTGEVYFDTAVLLLLLLTLGRFLEARARLRAAGALDGLTRLIPDMARRVLRAADGSCEFESVASNDLSCGDIVRVLANERISADGVIQSGAGAIDCSMMTGESDPTSCSTGQRVYCGTLVLDGSFDVEVLEPAGSRFVDRLGSLVRQARSQRPRIEELSERVSRWFASGILLIATGVFAYWTVQVGWFEALLISLSVLLIACPCALGFAAPLAISVALDHAARRGILIRRGDVFESLESPGSIYFDKTGTLTTLDSSVDRVVLGNSESEAELREVAAQIAAHSSHPFARTLLKSDSSVRSTGLSVDEQIPGLGLSAHDSEHSYLLGSARWLEQRGVDMEEAPALGACLCVARDETWMGSLVFSETLREGAGDLVSALRDEGWSVSVLTGDSADKGQALSERLDVCVHSELMPDEKLSLLRTKLEAGRTVMVGDGINDAPAIAAADVGVAFSSAADLARDTADVVVLEGRRRRVLRSLPYLLELSRMTMRRVRINVFGSFAYNAVGVCFAAAGWIHPILAALLMTASSLSVVLTSVRRFDLKSWQEPELPIPKDARRLMTSGAP